MIHIAVTVASVRENRFSDDTLVSIKINELVSDARNDGLFIVLEGYRQRTLKNVLNFELVLEISDLLICSLKPTSFAK